MPSLQMARKLEHKYLPQVWTSIKTLDSKWQERQECGHQKLGIKPFARRSGRHTDRAEDWSMIVARAIRFLILFL
jgi:hypothetical protein